MLYNTNCEIEDNVICHPLDGIDIIIDHFIIHENHIQFIIDTVTDENYGFLVLFLDIKFIRTTKNSILMYWYRKLMSSDLNLYSYHNKLT